MNQLSAQAKASVMSLMADMTSLKAIRRALGYKMETLIKLSRDAGGGGGPARSSTTST